MNIRVFLIFELINENLALQSFDKKSESLRFHLNLNTSIFGESPSVVDIPASICGFLKLKYEFESRFYAKFTIIRDTHHVYFSIVN